MLSPKVTPTRNNYSKLKQTPANYFNSGSGEKSVILTEEKGEQNLQMAGDNAKSPNSQHANNTPFSEITIALLHEIVSCLETLFSKELSPEQRSQINMKINPIVRLTQSFAEQVDVLKSNNDMVGFAEAANQYARNVIPSGGSTSSAIELMRGKLFSTAVPVFDYIEESKYNDYINSLKLLIKQKAENNIFDIVSYMMSVTTEIVDIYSWGQFITTDMSKINRYLSFGRKLFRKGLAERCIVEYGKMSGVYEKLIKIATGFSFIGSKPKPQYMTYAKRSLANNLGTLRTRGWGIFSADFDIFLRNSIAHKSWIIQPHEKTVLFSDGRGEERKSKSLSYQQIFEKTRDLSCLVLALAQFPGMIPESILIHLSSLLPSSRLEK